MESYPCKHHVFSNIAVYSDDELWTGLKIYNYLQKYNYNIPEHFMKYKNFKMPS